MVRLTVVLALIVLFPASAIAGAEDSFGGGVAGSVERLVSLNELYFEQPDFEARERHRQGVVAEDFDELQPQDVAQYGFNLLRTSYSRTSQLRVRSGVTRVSDKAAGGVQVILNW